MDESALLEVGNILACAYTSALSDFLGMAMIPTPPNMAFDMASAVMEYVMLSFEEGADNALVFHCKAGEKDMDLNLHILMLPPKDSLETMISRLSEIIATGAQ
jgi:chemotaxis protein CheC